MSAEQQLREALAYVEEAYDRKRNPNLSILLPAVGRLLEPIPDEVMEAATLAAVENPGRRQDAAWSVIRAWLIGGEKP